MDAGQYKEADSGLASRVAASKAHRSQFSTGGIEHLDREGTGDALTPLLLVEMSQCELLGISSVRLMVYRDPQDFRQRCHFANKYFG